VAPDVTTAQRPVVVIDADVLGQHRTGDETYVRGLLGALAEMPSSFDLVAATRRPDLVPNGISHLRTGRGGQAARLARHLPQLLHRAGADLFHGNYFLPARWAGRCVVTVHDISFARHRGFMPPHDLLAFRTLVPRAMRRAARVLTVSEWARADMVDRYSLDPDRVVVTPNGVDDDVTPDGPVAARPPYLLFVGGLQARKDPVTAVRALACLGRDLQLVIVGPDRGERRAVLEAAARSGLADRVVLLEYVERAELLALYRGAMALVFPSRYEGFGLPVLEAMGCGTPVVAAATTSLPEVVGGAGILVPPADAGALAEGIERALDDDGSLVTAGLARARLHRWSTTARLTAGVYAEVLLE
jgi:glycosyltransferase involved in cell wall biosynthesis